MEPEESVTGGVTYKALSAASNVVSFNVTGTVGRNKIENAIAWAVSDFIDRLIMPPVDVVVREGRIDNPGVRLAFSESTEALSEAAVAVTLVLKVSREAFSEAAVSVTLVFTVLSAVFNEAVVSVTLVLTVFNEAFREAVVSLILVLNEAVVSLIRVFTVLSEAVVLAVKESREVFVALANKLTRSMRLSRATAFVSDWVLTRSKSLIVLAAVLYSFVI